MANDLPKTPPPVPPRPERTPLTHATWQSRHEAKTVQRPADRVGKPGEPKKPDGAGRTPDTRAPVPSDMAKAAREIRGWVATEEKPVREYERIAAANPDSWEHNYRVSYAVNYALKQVGALPERHYTNAERAALSEKALWAMTALRKSDAKIGTSESLILRDAQRYLYGSLGDAWLQKHVTHKYHVPKEVAPYLDGKSIDRGYEGVVKPGDIAINAAAEELTGTNPGLGRGKAGMPHSRPGGEPWYDRGHARSDGADTRAPFILEVPSPARTPEDSAIRLAQPPGHVDLGHGESINLQTGRYTPGFGPKY
jgi:hypothetical protein